jgi:Phage terminase large subunit
MIVSLKPSQCRFVYSQKRFPAFVGGWATGKTLCAISRAQLYSKGIPDNLGVVFRKTARSLIDSTMADFERYTGFKVDSNRNFVYPNGSKIMFRHIDEIGELNQQNINLGWFYIEQGDEMDSDREFFLLIGRLRRDLKPTEEFIKLGLPIRSGWTIANAGDHWMRPLFKDGSMEDSELIEMVTQDNADVLPADFIKSLEIIKDKKPEVYKQFVLNDWSVNADQFILIKPALLAQLKDLLNQSTGIKKIISCDPATGGDECVIYVFENTEIVDEMILHYDDTMKIVGELMILGKKHNTRNYCVDSIGIGKGISDRLSELGMDVQPIQSAEDSSYKRQHYNKRTEIWWYTFEQIQSREVYPIVDAELRRQLSGLRYKVIDSNGKVQLEGKKDAKKRLGCSPDRADAYVYGIYSLQYVKEETFEDKKRDRYMVEIPDRDKELSIVNF